MNLNNWLLPRDDITLVVFKPSVLKKKLTGKILEILEENFSIQYISIFRFSKEYLMEFYNNLPENLLLQEVIPHMIDGDCILIILQGSKALTRIRKLIGSTKPEEACPGTIRFRFANDISDNLIHASSSVEDYVKEMKILSNILNEQKFK